MNTKKIITIVLLLFVAVSLVVLVVKRTRSVEGGAAQDLSDRLIVYSFHRNVRCENCQAIEAYAHKALQSGFKAQLDDGRIEWKVVNFEEPENKHFDADFELGEIPSVVLVQYQNNAVARSKNLTEVWRLVMGNNETEFIEYVQKELREFANM
jgi:hypothetical protein